MDTRARIIEATLTLLADRPFEEVTLRAIAREAGVSLAELAGEFSTRGAILRAYTRHVDAAVLADTFDDMADQPARDRLFDVLMNRLEVLRPNRHAIATLLDGARKDAQLALFLNALQLNSMRWMLEAASITPHGWRGRMAVQGLSIAFAKVLRVFVKEDDAGLPRTMAALDKALREAEQRHDRLSRVFGQAVHAEPPAPATPSAGRAVVPGAAEGGAETAQQHSAESAEPEAGAPPRDPAPEDGDDPKKPNDEAGLP